VNRLVITIGALCATVFLSSSVLADGLEKSAGLLETEGKQVYLVKPGDTLAGIAKKVYGDASRWPEILKANPQIAKANQIYPGDALVVGEAPKSDAADAGGSAAGGAGAAVAAKAEAPVAVEAKVIAPEEFMEAARLPADDTAILSRMDADAVSTLPLALFENCGFITAELPEAAIIGDPDAHLSLSAFNVVFMNRGDHDGLTVGQTFRVLRPVREVRHAVTGVSYGWLVKVVGRVETTCLQEKTGTARIVASYDRIAVGDRLEPVVPHDVPAQRALAPKLTGPCVPTTDGTPATILAIEDDRPQIAEGDIVMIDLGQSSGVVPGTKLVAYRTGPGHAGCTNYLVGELQILQSRNYTATALVTSSVAPLTVADRLSVW
jgi:LysM repeat protein